MAGELQVEPTRHGYHPIVLPSRRYRSQIQRMGALDTNYLELSARRKLSTEATRPNYNLRIMVGHTNFISSLHTRLLVTAQEVFGERLATELIAVDRELEVEDGIGCGILDCRQGDGMGVGDESWRYDDEDKEYCEEADIEESQEYVECEIPADHWFALLAGLAAKPKGVRIECRSQKASKQSDT
ncbi:MAG: hypothetical protein M1840_002013 [Geoglossum simile]|nr:MAG: hypothetical protein M1840_002013 [Geoglossum simile]